MIEALGRPKVTEREILLKVGLFDEFGVAMNFKTRRACLNNYRMALGYFLKDILENSEITFSKLRGSMKKPFSLGLISILNQAKFSPRLGVHPLDCKFEDAMEDSFDRNKRKRKRPSDIDLEIYINSKKPQEITGKKIIMGATYKTFDKFGVFIHA